MEGDILAIGKMAKCMEKVNLYGKMEGNTLENIMKIQSMDMGSFNG